MRPKTLLSKSSRHLLGDSQLKISMDNVRMKTNVFVFRKERPAPRASCQRDCV